MEKRIDVRCKCGEKYPALLPETGRKDKVESVLAECPFCQKKNWLHFNGAGYYDIFNYPVKDDPAPWNPPPLPTVS